MQSGLHPLVQSHYKLAITIAIVGFKHCPTEWGVAGVNQGNQTLTHAQQCLHNHSLQAGEKKQGIYVVMKF